MDDFLTQSREKRRKSLLRGMFAQNQVPQQMQAQPQDMEEQANELGRQSLLRNQLANYGQTANVPKEDKKKKFLELGGAGLAGGLLGIGALPAVGIAALYQSARKHKQEREAAAAEGQRVADLTAADIKDRELANDAFKAKLSGADNSLGNARLDFEKQKFYLDEYNKALERIHEKATAEHPLVPSPEDIKYTEWYENKFGVPSSKNSGVPPKVK